MTGLAYVGESSEIVIRKHPKPLTEASKHIDLISVPSNVALSHVRYASRGRPVYENTHLLTDCNSQVAVVGDGVIENFEEVKEVLERKGHVFASRTDTEVFAHLVEDMIKSGSGLLQVMAQATKVLRGFTP